MKILGGFTAFEDSAYRDAFEDAGVVAADAFPGVFALPLAALERVVLAISSKEGGLVMSKKPV